VLARDLGLADPERGREHRVMGLEPENAIAQALGDGHQLLGDPACRSVVTARRREEPAPPQRLETLRARAERFRDLGGPREDLFHARPAGAVRYLERGSKGEEQAELLVLPVRPSRQSTHQLEPLAEVRDRLPVGRAPQRLRPGLVEIRDGLVGELTPYGVASQPLDVLAQPVGVQALDRLDDARVERPPAVTEEGAVGDLVGQRVLEGVLERREQRGLVEELRGLEPVEMTSKVVPGQVGDGLEHVESHVGAHHRSRLQHALVVGRQAIDACGEERLHGGRHLDGVQRAQQAVAPTVPHQHVRLDERADAFLEEERRPFRPLDQHALERLDRGVVAEEAVEQLASAHRGQRVDPQLPVIGLRSPGVLVLGSVVHEHEYACRRQAVEERVDERLGLGVDPMEILEDEHDGLRLALAEEQSLDAFEDQPAALGGLKVLPLGVVGRGVENPQDGRQVRLERPVERQEAPQHLLPDQPRIVPGLDPEVGPQQVDDREVRRGLAVGDRHTGDDEAPVEPMRQDELVIEARLADAGLADDAHDLAATGPGVVERLVKLLELRGAPDEPRQPPRRRGLEARADGGGADELVQLDRIGEALHRRGAERADLDMALGQRQRVGGEENRARIGELLHARGQVGGLPHRRVVHAEVAADGAHDHVTRVQSHPDPHGDALSPAHLLGVALHRLLHPQCGVAGADRVILVGQGGAEQGHDAVAHDLVDRALVAMHRRHHELDHRLEHPPRLLGIAVGEQLQGALEVGE
jgi:hypothetical protein